MFSLYCLKPHQISFLSDVRKVCEKMKAIGLASCWPCDSQASWWSAKMVQKGRSQCGLKAWQVWKIWLNSLHVMSNVKVLLCKMASQPAGQTWLITYIQEIVIRKKKLRWFHIFVLNPFNKSYNIQLFLESVQIVLMVKADLESIIWPNTWFKAINVNLSA